MQIFYSASDCNRTEEALIAGLRCREGKVGDRMAASIQNAGKIVHRHPRGALQIDVIRQAVPAVCLHCLQTGGIPDLCYLS